MLDGGIQQSVARAGVKSDRPIVGVIKRRQKGHVAHATDVLHGPPALRMTQQKPVDVTGQRRALAAGGDVAGAHIADGGDASPFSDDRGFSDLQRCGDLAVGLDMMPKGVAMRADEVD